MTIAVKRTGDIDMSGRSDLFMVLGAVVLFSILLLNINGFLFNNQKSKTTSEIEYNGIALAQDIIDQARWKSFDEMTQYEGYSAVDSTESGVYDISADVVYIDPTSTNGNKTHGTTDYRKLTVTVQNKFLNYPIQLSYIKAR